MSKTLIIVESPAKARTISRFLGRDYVVESSIGHIRDLPKSAAEIPARVRAQPWARLGLDVEHDFAPVYVVPPEKRAQVAKLKGLARTADEIVLATDDDREGESIAWHLRDELKPKVPVKRMVFHEITREAIEAAVRNPREINENLVQAQEARRALDRLYGFEVSPVLWKKVQPRLSAGRVQSVATRLLVQRERERMSFLSGSWWDLDAALLAHEESFTANLTSVNGTRLATGKDFDPATGRLREGVKSLLLHEAVARDLAEGLEGALFTVVSAEEKPYTQRPYAPFITSTLQQEGGRKLGFAASRTMRAAQRLYEGGFITYMRTDSTTLSREAMSAARDQVLDLYGQEYLHPSVRVYDKKSKNAQEAHEAIRPAGEHFRTPEALRAELQGDEFRLYDLIWKRTVASQMADARGKRLSVRLSATTKPKTDGSRDETEFTATGRSIEFAGFLRAYVEGHDDPSAALEDREVILPPLKPRDTANARVLTPRGHDTQPPARYTEASLVQGLEAAGIGRPSTYATILSTIQDRGYAFKRGSALVPTFTAMATVGLLEQHFGQLVDYDFTARMEEDLDEIAAGRRGRGQYLHAFYFGPQGDDGLGLKELIETRLEAIDPRVAAVVPVAALDGSGIEARVGRFGPFIRRGEERGSLPPEIAPDELTLQLAEELLAGGGKEHELGADPQSGLAVIARAGRYGPYVQLGVGPKPERSSSLLPGDDLDTMTLERALTLLSLPRRVGQTEEGEVFAHNGRFGPYLKRGGDTRSLENHEQLFTVTLEEAERLLAAPKAGRRANAVTPLKLFPFDDRAVIELRKGRYGPYLTDGAVNASLRAEEDAESLSAADARAILEDRGRAPKNAGKPVRRGAGATRRPPAKRKAPAKGTTKPSGVRATKPARAAARRPASATTKRAAAKKLAVAPAKVSVPWESLQEHLNALPSVERDLVRAVRADGRKVQDAAADLNLDERKARGMLLTAYRKLNAAHRAAHG